MSSIEEVPSTTAAAAVTEVVVAVPAAEAKTPVFLSPFSGLTAVSVSPASTNSKEEAEAAEGDDNEVLYIP